MKTTTRLALLALSLALVPACGGVPEPKMADRITSADGKVTCEVIDIKSRRGDGKFFLEVLVPEATSQQDVLDLAETLKQRFTGRIAVICIWDSREACYHAPAWHAAVSRGEVYKAYPWQEIGRHWLATIETDEKVRWVAEGRNH